MRRSGFIKTGGYIRGRAKNMYNKPANKGRRKRRWPILPLSFTQKMGTSTSRALGFGNFAGSLTSTSPGYASTRVMPNAGGGSSKSFYRSSQRFHPMARSIKRTGSSQTFILSYARKLSNLNYGRQAVTTFDSCSFANIATMLNDIPVIAGTATLTKSAVLASSSFEYTMSNMSEASAFLDIYEMVTRHIIPSGQTPDVLFDNGVQDQSTDGTAITGSQILGIKPTASLALTSLYKIKRHYRVELNQGQTHVHYSKHALGFKFNNELLEVFGSSNFHPRASRFLMIVAQGAPCSRTDAPAVVSTTPVSIDIVGRCTHTWYYNVPTTKNTRYGNFLGAIDYTSQSGRILDIGSGEIETVQAT